jgi:hypothetical protein
LLLYKSVEKVTCLINKTVQIKHFMFGIKEVKFGKINLFVPPQTIYNEQHGIQYNTSIPYFHIRKINFSIFAQGNPKIVI